MLEAYVQIKLKQMPLRCMYKARTQATLFSYHARFGMNAHMINVVHDITSRVGIGISTEQVMQRDGA